MGVKIVIAIVALYVLVAVGVSWWLWDCLSWGEPSTSAVIRNIVLTLGTPLAVFLAVWRSSIAQQQAEVAQRGLLSARYQRAVEMLGHELVSVRIGGVYALRNLALEHDEYKPEVHTLLTLYSGYGKATEALDQSNIKSNPVDMDLARSAADMIVERIQSQKNPIRRRWRRLCLWLKNLCKRSQNT